ncbi:gp53-like domain-containing protein [Enterobacter roggenkampii]|uniref:gp53-like domain-containing protein n=1 Tax=Enterobacter roggenkampii TaxID=1812935 RepID=UPI002814EF16|nr:phage tail protein [Enterobacter roggenkampii]
MAKNDFKPFATGAGANVMSQADWEALPALLSGFTAGKASSAQVNKAIRQAAFIAAALAQYSANKSGLDVLDDGDLNGFITKMSTAFGKDFQALDATLTALAGLSTDTDKLPYFTGTDTASLTTLTSVGRNIIGKSAVADVLTYLGLGEAAKRGVWGGSGDVTAAGGFSLGVTGAFKLPTGTIVQWDEGFTASGGFTKNYPVPFPNQCLVLTPVVYSTLGAAYSVLANKSSKTQANFNVVNTSGSGVSGISAGYIAIGY